MIIASGVILVANFLLSLIPYLSTEIGGTTIKLSMFSGNPGLSFVGLAIAVLLFISLAADDFKTVGIGLSFVYAVYILVNSIQILIASKDVSNFIAVGPVAGLLAGIAIIVLSIITFARNARGY